MAKTARVVEEVVVGKEETNLTETIHDTVRGTEVEVERTAGNRDVADGAVPPAKKTPL